MSYIMSDEEYALWMDQALSEALNESMEEYQLLCESEINDNTEEE